MSFLLDTNILSALLRNPTGPVARIIRQHPITEIGTSIIVSSELRFGAIKRNSRKFMEDIEGLLSRLEVFAFESPADRLYGQIRFELEAAGLPIGGNDLLIAAHALSLRRILVTDNEREFSRIENLRVENWLR
jgi:tRNA(fMet)-specific endonuclease VapC